MNKINRGLVLTFCFFFFAIIVLNILTPDRVFSEFENRNLAQKPKFTVNSLIEGKFTSGFEKYVTEQFALRDWWVSLKSTSERIFGKKENNGVYFGKDNYLLEKFDKVDYEQIDKNIKSINEFAKKTVGIDTYFMLVPNSTEILKDKLPPYAPHINQRELMDNVYAKLEGNVKVVDIYSELLDKKDENIFYRTDHHWTTKGAYYGYNELMKGMGIQPLKETDFDIEVASESFYGTLYSKAAARWGSPDNINLYIPKNKPEFKVTIMDDGKTMDSLYEKKHLDTKDKYSAFLDGNHALTTINSGLKNNSKVLVIKDSFAHSLVPFMANNFSEIHMADLRYLKMDLISYCKQNKIDKIVFTYSVSNFSSDNNLIWLNAFGGK